MICFGTIIICINLEIFLVKHIVDGATDSGEGVLVPKLHKHPIFLKKKFNYWLVYCCLPANFYFCLCVFLSVCKRTQCHYSQIHTRINSKGVTLAIQR